MHAATGRRVFGISRQFVSGVSVRLFAIMMAFLAFTAVSSSKPSDKPSELEMCLAFQAYLSEQVQSVLDFIVETRGAEGLASVRKAHTDQFEISSFTQSRCERIERMPSHVCTFSVDIVTVKGAIEQTVTGCFVPKPGNHLVFLPRALQQASDGDDPAPVC